MSRLAWITLGGAAGTAARYLLATWIYQRWGTGFAWGTLAVNLIGSYLIGFLMQVGAASDLLSPTARLALTTGVMGGFTTCSSFSWETLGYLSAGAWRLGALNIAATVAGALTATFLGVVTGRWLFGT
ncbi:MAG: CrcB family protein [Planctomycetes bacterium]|nr:CrcB family protein [Planctomycetota bacterium]